MIKKLGGWLLLPFLALIALIFRPKPKELKTIEREDSDIKKHFQEKGLQRLAIAREIAVADKKLASLEEQLDKKPGGDEWHLD